MSWLFCFTYCRDKCFYSSLLLDLDLNKLPMLFTASAAVDTVVFTASVPVLAIDLVAVVADSAVEVAALAGVL